MVRTVAGAALGTMVGTVAAAAMVRAFDAYQSRREAVAMMRAFGEAWKAARG